MNIRRTSGPCINPPTPPQWPSSQFKNLHSRQFQVNLWCICICICICICGVFDTIQEIGILDIEYKWKVLKLIPCWKRLMNINQNSAIVHLLQLSPRKFGLIVTIRLRNDKLVLIRSSLKENNFDYYHIFQKLRREMSFLCWEKLC